MNDELRAADSVLLGNDALLATVFAGSGDCIKILDLDGNVQFMSEGGKRVMEVEDFGAMKGCPWPDLWRDEGNVGASRAIDEARAGRSFRFTGPAETAKGTPKYWDVQVLPILGPDGRPTHLLSISKDITDLHEGEARQRYLAAELQHRIKNMLAMVNAIASQTLRGDDVADRLATFRARITALSTAQNLLNTDGDKAADIRSVLDLALEPHQSAIARFDLGGPLLELTPKQSLSMALAIHELATNATKYGALSDDRGRVSINWSVDQAGENAAMPFAFRWQEHGGPAVMPPTQSGFGSRLVTAVLRADFRGDVRLDYPPSGFVCVLTAPLPTTNVAG